MQIIKTHDKNPSFESQKENIMGKEESPARVPLLNREAGKKEEERRKATWKKLWWPHPLSHFNQSRKTDIFKAPR